MVEGYGDFQQSIDYSCKMYLEGYQDAWGNFPIPLRVTTSKTTASNMVLMALLETECWLLVSLAMSLEKIKNLMFHVGFFLLNMSAWDFSKNGKGCKSQTTSQFPFKVNVSLY